MKRIGIFNILVILVCTMCFVNATAQESKQRVKDEIVMPQYPGGEDALRKFLLKELQYPYEAQEIEAKGEVVVSFFVERSGSITGVHVIQPVAPELDAEAVRVIRKMPRWSPGKKNGVVMRAQMSMPINFKYVKSADKYVDGETLDNGFENRSVEKSKTK